MSIFDKILTTIVISYFISVLLTFPASFLYNWGARKFGSGVDFMLYLFVFHTILALLVLLIRIWI